MKCMETNFGGHGLSGFRDITPFSLPSKTAKISLQTMNYIVHGGQKIESAQKIYASRGYVKCMETNFGRHSISSFEDFACIQKCPNFPFRP